MKQICTTMILAVAMLFGASVTQKTFAQPAVGVSITYQNFYDELSPHGRWIDYPEYGYVWTPNMGGDFQPYSTGGHWVWSDDYEWMWVSDYSWGWAPFHYGNWFHDDMYGWMWVPGYEWSPAWVSWRTGGDYYGWAPVRPGINISIGFGNYNPPSNYWCFTPRRYIGQRNMRNHYIDRRQNVTIINNTTIINNYGRRNNVFVNGGPRRQEAERYAGRINPVRFRESNSPGRTRVRNNEVSIYRPSIQRSSGNFTPRNAERFDRNRQQGNANVRREEGNRPTIRDRASTENRTRADRRNENGIRPQSDERTTIRERGNDNNRITRPEPRTRESVGTRERVNGNNNREERIREPRTQEQRQQRIEPREQRVEQPQREQRPQRMEQPQRQQRMEQPQRQQRMEQPQRQQRMEQPQRQQRMEQPQRQQRMEQPQRQQRVQEQRQQPSRSFEPRSNGGGRTEQRGRRER